MVVSRGRGGQMAAGAACGVLLLLLPAFAGAQSAYASAGGYAEDGSDGYETVSFPYVRAMFGGAALQGPDKAWSSGGVLEAVGGFRYAATRHFTLSFEVAYTGELYELPGGAPSGRQLASTGVGPGLYVNRFFAIGWMPKLVLGEALQGFAVGVRNSIVVPLLYQIVVVEAGHQWLQVAGHQEQEVRVLAGADAWALCLLFFGEKPRNMVEMRR